jgi:PEP-CTERM motif
MSNNLKRLMKASAFTFLFAALLTLGAQTARADEVFFSGYTNGCFNCNPPPVPNTSATQTATIFALNYTNSQFSGTSAGGFMGVGAAPSAFGVQGTNNLGSFTLNSSLANYNGSTFTLRVTFTAPEGIAGMGSSSLFTATLVGTVTSTGNGGVLIDFNNTPQMFTFSDPNCQATTVAGQQTTCGSGSFSFAVNDVAITPGQTVSLTGQITNASQTPEPATMALFGTGLSGFAAAARRRRRLARARA